MSIHKVLVVDDSKTELMFMTDLLQQNGFSVKTAENADESTRADALADLAVVRSFSGLSAAAVDAAEEALYLYEAKGNVVRVRTTRALLASVQPAAETSHASSAPGSKAEGIPS